MRIHIWTADEMGSAWYRGHLTGMSLIWLGHQVTVGMRLPEDWERCDTIVGCRIAIPGASEAWRRMKGLGIRLVVDLDDDYFHPDPVNERAASVWTPALRESLVENMRIADAVTCCSEPLAAVLREYHHDVRVIGNGLPAQYLGTPRDYNPDVIRVGWAGSASTLAELPLVARHLNRIAQTDQVTQVCLVGVSAEQAMGAGARGRRVGALGWVADQGKYLQAVSEFDIWVAPYRDIAFNHAKFATKALEAGFLGIPLIATAIEPYRAAVVHGETGFLVPPGQEHLFGRYLKQLVGDPALRQSMGMAARAKASGQILQVLNQQWEKALTA